MFFPTTTIKVERNVKVGETPSGSDVLKLITIHESVHADLQAIESEFIVVIAGQTAMSHKRVFVDRIDILEGDFLTDLSDMTKHRVVSVNDYKVWGHKELEAVSGVV